MQVKTCVRVAELLHVNPMLVIAGVQHEMAHTDEDRAFWIQVFAQVQYDGRDRRSWFAKA